MYILSNHFPQVRTRNSTCHSLSMTTSIIFQVAKFFEFMANQKYKYENTATFLSKFWDHPAVTRSFNRIWCIKIAAPHEHPLWIVCENIKLWHQRSGDISGTIENCNTRASWDHSIGSSAKTLSNAFFRFVCCPTSMVIRDDVKLRPFTHMAQF